MAVLQIPDETPLDPTLRPGYSHEVGDTAHPVPGPSVNAPELGISRLAPLGELACSGAYLPLLNV